MEDGRLTFTTDVGRAVTDAEIIFIADYLVEGIFRLFFSDRTEPTNIGNPVEFTVKGLAELVVKMTGTDSQIVYRSLPENDPQVRQPDITMGERVLEWRPKVPLHDGLRRTIDYFREIAGAGEVAAPRLVDARPSA